MKRRATSLIRIDALVAATERKIADQIARIEAAHRGARALGRMTCRLADLRIDLIAYRQARNAVAEAQRSTASRANPSTTVDAGQGISFPAVPH